MTVDRKTTLLELEQARLTFHKLLDNATVLELRSAFNGTKWTNEELLCQAVADARTGEPRDKAHVRLRLADELRKGHAVTPSCGQSQLGNLVPVTHAPPYPLAAQVAGARGGEGVVIANGYAISRTWGAVASPAPALGRPD